MTSAVSASPGAGRYLGRHLGQHELADLALGGLPAAVEFWRARAAPAAPPRRRLGRPAGGARRLGWARPAGGAPAPRGRPACRRASRCPPRTRSGQASGGTCGRTGCACVGALGLAWPCPGSPRAERAHARGDAPADSERRGEGQDGRAHVHRLADLLGVGQHRGEALREQPGDLVDVDADVALGLVEDELDVVARGSSASRGC